MEDRFLDIGLFGISAKIVRTLNHLVDACPDGLPGGIEVSMVGWRDVLTIQGVVEPGLRFRRLAHASVSLLMNEAG
jgi:hypothetical protein